MAASVTGNAFTLTDTTGATLNSTLTGLSTATVGGTPSVNSLAAGTNTIGVAAYATVNGVNSTSTATNTATGKTTFSFAGGTLDGLALSATTSALTGTLGTFSATKDTPPAAIGTLSATADRVTAGNALQFQIGSNQYQTVALSIGSTKSDSVGAYTNTASGKSYNLSDLGQNGALDLTDVTGKSQQDALAVIDQAINDISAASEKLGSVQTNVLQSNINSLAVSQSNNDSSLSTVRDTDLAATVVDYTKNQILVQAGYVRSVLCQPGSAGDPEASSVIRCCCKKLVSLTWRGPLRRPSFLCWQTLGTSPGNKFPPSPCQGEGRQIRSNAEGIERGELGTRRVRFFVYFPIIRAGGTSHQTFPPPARTALAVGYTGFMNTHLSKARAAQESGLVSLETLAPAISACWTIGAFGRQRLYILSGKFGPEQRFCSRYVVYPESGPELPQASRWRFCLLHGQQDYTKGRLDILQTELRKLLTERD